MSSRLTEFRGPISLLDVCSDPPVALPRMSTGRVAGISSPRNSAANDYYPEASDAFSARVAC